jgi:hypothetical protein
MPNTEVVTARSASAVGTAASTAADNCFHTAWNTNVPEPHAGSRTRSRVEMMRSREPDLVLLYRPRREQPEAAERHTTAVFSLLPVREPARRGRNVQPGLAKVPQKRWRGDQEPWTATATKVRILNHQSPRANRLNNGTTMHFAETSHVGASDRLLVGDDRQGIQRRLRQRLWGCVPGCCSTAAAHSGADTSPSSSPDSSSRSRRGGSACKTPHALTRPT